MRPHLEARLSSSRISGHSIGNSKPATCRSRTLKRAGMGSRRSWNDSYVEGQLRPHSVRDPPCLGERTRGHPRVGRRPCSRPGRRRGSGRPIATWIRRYSLCASKASPSRLLPGRWSSGGRSKLIDASSMPSALTRAPSDSDSSHVRRYALTSWSSVFVTGMPQSQTRSSVGSWQWTSTVRTSGI